jgi:aspartyl-tRNA(Asn)/glutamyl-tRNA(Gln) amidotransferase subunit B
MQIIQGHKGEWELVIGLEIHAQITSESKLFSASATKFGAKQNTQVSFVDAGMPGMLPVLNRECVDQAIRTGLGLNAEINLFSVFDRKNYFYPDLPQGYQISQFTYPIVGRGIVTIELSEQEVKDIRITRIHLEQDAGKSIHDQSPTETFIDLNRSGIALMEIVTEPDLRSSEEAAEFMKKLRSILRYLGTCDGNMEQGSLRCDANVSVRPRDSTELGTRVEIKNLNSMKYVAKAITFEAERQVEVLEDGGEITQETRLFDTVTGETRTMRDKEDATDYRYFPDPDLLPLVLEETHIEQIRKSLPELPDAKKMRYVKELGLPLYDASVITADRDVAVYFEALVAKKADAKLAANWIMSELFGRLKKANIGFCDSPISVDNFVSLLAMISDSTISGRIAKEVFDIMFETGAEAAKIVEEKGLKQITNTGEIEGIVEAIITANSDVVEKYKNGETKLLGFLVGQVMKKTQNKANPKLVNELFRKNLGGNE